MNRFVINCNNASNDVIMTLLVKSSEEISIKDFSDKWDKNSKDLLSAAQVADCGDEVIRALSLFAEEQFPEVEFEFIDIPSYTLENVNI